MRVPVCLHGLLRAARAGTLLTHGPSFFIPMSRGVGCWLAAWLDGAC